MPAGKANPIHLRELNRALLARQMLLMRKEFPVRLAVEHLVGLQAQASLPPYIGLWARLERFDPHELGRMLTEREVVRITLMRGTIHLVTVPDALTLRPLMQPAIERTAGPVHKRAGRPDGTIIRSAVREMLSNGPMTARELATRLVERGIGTDAVSLGYVVAAFAPLVQVPPRGVWGASGQAQYATLESWTGRDVEKDPSIDDLVLRYLRAFGPASVMDMQAWSGLTRLKDAFERQRHRLVTYADEDGKELFDLPDAPRPDADSPAPVRFLGEYDNILLGHRDRRRIIPENFPWSAMLAEGRFVSALLVDGMLRATWRIDRTAKKSATLCIRPFGRLSRTEREEVADEAERMVRFVAPDAGQHVVCFETAVE